MLKIGVSQVDKNNILWCENFFVKIEILLLTLGYPRAIITKHLAKVRNFEARKLHKKLGPTA